MRELLRQRRRVHLPRQVRHLGAIAEHRTGDGEARRIDRRRRHAHRRTPRASHRTSHTRCSRTAAPPTRAAPPAIHRRAAAEPSSRRCHQRRFSCGVVLHRRRFHAETRRATSPHQTERWRPRRLARLRLAADVPTLECRFATLAQASHSAARTQPIQPARTPALRRDYIASSALVP